jgi:hypothetical protein
MTDHHDSLWPTLDPNQIGKMSGVVLSDSGYHLIFRYA